MSYQVNFYREIVNSFGKPFNVSVYMAEIETSASLNDAIAAAIEAFKRDQGLRRWQDLADGYEVTDANGLSITTHRGVSVVHAGQLGRLFRRFVNRANRPSERKHAE
jgi:hypothetical protein